jgi:NitT/TauT family transport system substrate-binding protein
MKGYVKSARYYYDAALLQKDGRPWPGPAYDEVVTITAKYTGSTPEIVRRGFPYQDRNGRLWVEDIGRQMGWWQKQGFLKATMPLKDIVDTSFLEAARRAVGE